MAGSTAGKVSLTYTCKLCGSVVDKLFTKQHSEMHKFMREVVEALENHKKEIDKIKDGSIR